MLAAPQRFIGGPPSAMIFEITRFALCAFEFLTAASTAWFKSLRTISAARRGEPFKIPCASATFLRRVRAITYRTFLVEILTKLADAFEIISLSFRLDPLNLLSRPRVS